jgi:hypothetical protein
MRSFALLAAAAASLSSPRTPAAPSRHVEDAVARIHAEREAAKNRPNAAE